jgi:hypothetical protein
MQPRTRPAEPLGDLQSALGSGQALLGPHPPESRRGQADVHVAERGALLALREHRLGRAVVLEGAVHVHVLLEARVIEADA